MKQYNGITERQMQIGACLIIALILGSIHLALPGFYSTLITLAMDGNVPGLQAYILSYGYLSMAISILMISVLFRVLSSRGLANFSAVRQALLSCVPSFAVRLSVLLPRAIN